MKPVRFGLSGFAAPALQDALYGPAIAPERMLETYAETFDAYEMACSSDVRFTRQAADAILTQAPPHLRLLPHYKADRFDGPRHAQWTHAVEPILRSPRLGPVYVQWGGRRNPAATAALEETLSALWQALPLQGEIAVEFQDASWFQGDALRILEEHEATLVWSTRTGLVPYKVTGHSIYVRLTGSVSRRIPDEVGALVQRARARHRDDRPLYVIGAQQASGYGLHAVERFADRIGRPLGQRPRVRDQAPLEAFAAAY